MSEQLHLTSGHRSNTLRRMLCLQGLVFLNWGAWLLGAMVLYGLYRLRITHPHFILLTIPMGLHIALSLGIGIRGLWGVARGPRRLNTLAWLLIGIGPVWLGALHASYCLWKVDVRQMEFNLPLKTGMVAGALVGDAAIRLRYPWRQEGSNVVMWSGRRAEDDRELKAMDRHIARLEDILGRKCRAKVYWIRGSVFGFRGNENLGLALGEDLGTRRWRSDEPTLDDELNTLDRHEVAHFVINHLCGPDAEPPMILVEGWAEAQSGLEPPSLAKRAWRLNREGAPLGIRDLTSDNFYGRTVQPMYSYGAAFVDFLLRAYGGVKFFELYSTCRRNSFPEDCRRVLGLSMDELDRAFWADVERQVGSEERPGQQILLASAHLASGVNANMWRELATRQPEAASKARAFYQQVRVTAETRRVFPRVADRLDDGAPIRVVECFRDGESGRVVFRDSLEEFVTVTNPQKCFSLRRMKGEDRWREDRSEHTGLAAYDLVGSHRLVEYFTDDCLGIAFLPLEDHPVRGILGPDLSITKIEPLKNEGHRLWRVDFESAVPRLGGKERRRGWFVVAPDGGYTIQSYEVHCSPPNGAGYSQRGLMLYNNVRDGIPVIREYRLERLDESGKQVSDLTTKITRCEFGPTAREEFTPEAFGLKRSSLGVPTGIPWFVSVTALGCLGSLTLGLALLAILRRSNSTSV